MLEIIIKAIGAALHEAFPNVTIYAEDVPQGLTEPCFFISLLNTAQKPRLGYRFLQNYFFNIQYFPESENRANAEMYSVALALYECLEYISYGEWRFKGIDMRHEQQEGILHFFITFYAAGEREKERLATMEHLTIQERVKQYGHKK